MTPSRYILQGALFTVFNDGIRKGDDEFPLVFNNNFTSIKRRVRDNDVFMHTGNNVKVMYPLGMGGGCTAHFFSDEL